jgi:hypothetical protein
VPQSGNGGQPGDHARADVAPLGYGPGQSLQLDGYHFTVRYTQSHLKVAWDNGTEVILPTAGRQITAHVEVLLGIAEIVTLAVIAPMAAPEPWHSQVDLLFTFPLALRADVQRLAEWLNAEREDRGPADTAAPDAGARMPPAGPAPPGHQPRPLAPEPPSGHPAEPRSAHGGPGQGTPGHDGHPGGAPARPVPPARPQPGHPQAAPPPAELPAVVFQADLAGWADDPDWIGLYPSFETGRLIAGPPHRQPSSPQSA